MRYAKDHEGQHEWNRYESLVNRLHVDLRMLGVSGTAMIIAQCRTESRAKVQLWRRVAPALLRAADREILDPRHVGAPPFVGVNDQAEELALLQDDVAE